MRRPPRTQRRGFSLIEMMMVITIIAILIALLLPAVQQAREAARRTQCKNNLVQLGISMHTYNQSFSMLPPGCVNETGPIVNESYGYHMSWVVQVLAHMDQTPLFQQMNFSAGAYDSNNPPAAMLPAFVCPSDTYDWTNPADAPTSYAGVTGGWDVPIDVDNEGLLFLNSSVAYREIRDGASNTLLVGERRLDDFEQQDLGYRSGTGATLRHTAFSPNARPLDNSSWSQDQKPWPPPRVLPNAPPVPPADQAIGGFSSFHVGGAQFALADGSVRFISENVDAIVFHNIGNRADGNLVAEF